MGSHCSLATAVCLNNSRSVGATFSTANARLRIRWRCPNPLDFLPFPMDAIRYAHVKLLAVDFLSLAVSSSAPPSISRRGRPIHRAEFAGVVVSRDRRPKLLRFLIDDGSGCVPCVLWLNQNLLSRASAFASGDDLAASAAGDNAGKVQIGVLIRVRGRVTVFRGELQITVKDVLVERDPNAEILHWLQCMKLARDCYDLPLAKGTKV